MLFTPENLDIISTGRVSGIHASNYGGSWKNSFIFYVNVDSEWNELPEYVLVFSSVLGPTALKFAVEQFIAHWSPKRRWYF